MRFDHAVINDAVLLRCQVCGKIHELGKISGQDLKRELIALVCKCGNSIARR